MKKELLSVQMSAFDILVGFLYVLNKGIGSTPSDGLGEHSSVSFLHNFFLC